MAQGSETLWLSNRSLLSYVYWTVHPLDSWIKRDQLDVTCFFISLFNAKHVSDVLTSETCWVLNNEIKKQVTSSWSIFIELALQYFVHYMHKVPGFIKAYLHKYKIIDDPTCPCRKGQQTVQHIIFDCALLEKEREKLKAEVKRSENWPVNCNKLAVQYHRIFKEYIDNISWNED